LSYLTFLDLKALRVVSRHFLGMIEAYDRFKDSQILVISKEKVSLGELEPDFLMERTLMDLTWLDIRNIRINVYDVERQSLHIPNLILNNVKFVSLLSNDIHYEDNEEPVPVRSIQRILSSTRQISRLQLDLNLAMVNLSDVFDSSDVIKDNLKNLKTLDILGWTRMFGSSTYWIDDEYLPNLMRNLDQMASALQRLERFHLPVLWFTEQEPESKIQSSVVNLLQRNRESLQELSIHFRIWRDILPVTLPRLKSLRATVSISKEQDSLKDFLANTNKDCFKELDVAVRRQNDCKFGMSLFNTIRQCSPCLTKLHLLAFTFADEEGYEFKVDWTFLGEMKCLKDFQLARPLCSVPNWDSYGTGTLLLESLPSNQLERLSLRGFGFKNLGFWKNDVGDMEPELPFKLNLLRGFQNLKRLSLRYCPDAVDDDILRFIVEEMTSLEELEVSHCSRLTDRGIAGTSEDGSDSIRNLKREWKYK